MEKIIDWHICTGCGACANRCPQQCIHMRPDGRGFLHPVIDADRCIDCRKCRDVCPVQPTADRMSSERPFVYAACHRDGTVVEQSSSGGVFYALAAEVLAAGGVVFGAAFDPKQMVHHVAVSTLEGVPSICRSKYVQSDVGFTYREAERELIAGRTVLFSGTPCQIAGLRHFLQRDYDQLFCVELICHSVPSPKVWEAFLRESVEGQSIPIVSVNFRDKRDSWEKYCLTLTYADGREQIFSGDDNLYMQAFIGGLSSRQSCANCLFKGSVKEADITLGDYWGVHFVQPDAHHKRGTSVILVHTERGAQLLQRCAGKLVLVPSTVETALPPNPAYSRPSLPHPRRKQFFEDLDKIGFVASVKKNYPPIGLERGLKAVKRTLPYRVVAKVKRMVCT